MVARASGLHHSVRGDAAMKSIHGALLALERLMGAIFRYATAALLFVLMIVTCVDVLGRYFFNHPIYGGFELTEVILAIMIFCALPLVTAASEHVTVDLVTVRGRWLLIVQHFLTNLAGCIITAVLARQLWLRGVRLGRAGETTVQIEIPLAYVTYTMSALMAVTALAFLVQAFRPGSAAATTSELV